MVQQKNFIEKIISAGIEISDSPIKIIKINKEIKFQMEKDLYQLNLQL